MSHHRYNGGWIEVVCGSMFSGKTEELIRRVKRATIAKQKVQVFKPAVDTRYVHEKVTSHSGAQFQERCVRVALEERWGKREAVAERSPVELVAPAETEAVCV